MISYKKPTEKMWVSDLWQPLDRLGVFSETNDGDSRLQVGDYQQLLGKGHVRHVIQQFSNQVLQSKGMNQ